MNGFRIRFVTFALFAQIAIAAFVAIDNKDFLKYALGDFYYHDYIWILVWLALCAAFTATSYALQAALFRGLPED